MEKVLKYSLSSDCKLESSQRDKSNKQPKQASINSWLQPGLPLYIMRLVMIGYLMQFYQTLKTQSSNVVNNDTCICKKVFK